jgi:hypothetical protein
MKLFILWLSLLALPSCSGLRIGFLWADTFFVQATSRYFTLDEDERAAAQAQVKEVFKALRAEKVPLLAASLESFAGRIEAGRESAAPDFLKEAEPILQSSLRAFEPVFQSLILMEAGHGFKKFDAAFLKRWKKQNALDAEEHAEELLSRYERVVKETIEFTTPEQQKWMEKFAQENSNVHALEIDSRRAVFEAFRGQRDDPQKRDAFVKRYFQDWSGLQTSEYARARTLYQERSRALVEKVLKNLTAKQRMNLVENMRSRANELRGL